MSGFTKRNWGTQPGGQTQQAGGQPTQTGSQPSQTSNTTQQPTGQQPFANSHNLEVIYGT